MMSRTPTSLVVQPAAAAQPKNLEELKKKQQELLSKQLEQQKVRVEVESVLYWLLAWPQANVLFFVHKIRNCFNCWRR